MATPKGPRIRSKGGGEVLYDFLASFRVEGLPKSREIPTLQVDGQDDELVHPDMIREEPRNIYVAGQLYADGGSDQATRRAAIEAELDNIMAAFNTKDEVWLSRGTDDTRYIPVRFVDLSHSYVERVGRTIAVCRFQFRCFTPHWYSLTETVSSWEIGGDPVRIEAEDPYTSDAQKRVASPPKYVGQWAPDPNQFESGNKAYVSDTPGDYVELTFHGRAISLIYTKSANHGIADILIDGSAPAENDTVDMYAASNAFGETVSWSGLTPGEHTLRITVGNSKNAASSGYRIRVDAFDIIPAKQAVIDNAGNDLLHAVLRVRPREKKQVINAVGKTQANTGHPIKAFSKNSATLPAPTDPGWTEVADAGYTNMAVEDGQTSGPITTVDGEYPHRMIQHDVTNIADGTEDKVKAAIRRIVARTKAAGRGAISGTLIPGMAYVQGKFDQGIPVQGPGGATVGDMLQIDGAPDKIDVNQGTIILWLRPEWSGDDGASHVLFDARGPGSTNYLPLVLKNTDNLLQAAWTGDNKSASVAVTSANMSSGQLHMIVMRWDVDGDLDGLGNRLGISLNGAHTYGTTTDLTVGTVGDLMALGSDSTGKYSANGIIDDAAIIRRPITDAEISNLYNAGAGRTADYIADTDLLWYWNMDGSGRFAYGESPTTLSGVATGNYPQLQKDTTGESSGTTIARTGADSDGWASGDEVVITGAGAIRFDGNYAEFDTPFQSDQPFTIELWYAPTRMPQTYDTIFGGADNDDIQLMWNPLTNHLRTSIENIEMETAFELTQDKLNKPLHIGFTFGNGRRKCYVGEGDTYTLVLDQADNTGLTITSPKCRIANSATTILYAAGDVDEFRAWNVVRSQSDLADNRFREMTDAPGLLLRLGFNEMTGNTAADTAVAINKLSAEDASFEGGTVGSWNTAGANTIAPSTAQAANGLYSLQATYQDNLILARTGYEVTVVGRYAFAGEVFIPADWDGGEIRMDDDGTYTGRTVVTDQRVIATNMGVWVRFYKVLDIVSAGLGYFLVRSSTAPTAGKSIYLDKMFIEKLESDDTEPTTWVPGGKTPFDATLVNSPEWRGDGVLGAKSDRVTIAALGVTASGLTVSSAITGSYGKGARVYRTKRADGKPTNRLVWDFEMPFVVESLNQQLPIYHVTNDEAFSGEGSLSLEVTQSNYASVIYIIPVTSGEEYTIEGWMKAGNAGADACILLYDDSNGKWIISDSQYVGGSTVTNTANWEKRKSTFKVPEGCSGLRVYLRVVGAPGSLAYFDNIRLIPSKVANGGMEGTHNLLGKNASNGGEDGTTTGYGVVGVPSVSSVDSVTTAPHGGSRCIRVNATQGYQGVQVQADATIGQTYYGRIWLKGDVGGELVQVVLRDSIGNNIQITNHTLTTAWAEYLVSGAALTSDVIIRINTQNGATGTFYVDDAQITEGVSASWEEGTDATDDKWINGVAPGWGTTGGNLSESSDSHSGGKSQKIVGSGGQGIREFNVLPIGKVLVSFWAKVTSGTLQVSNDYAEAEGTVSITAVENGGAWKRYAFVHSSSSTRNLWLRGISGSNDVLVDDVSIIELDSLDVVATPRSEANHYETGVWSEGLHVGYGDELKFSAANAIQESAGTMFIPIKGKGDWISQPDGNDIAFFFSWVDATASNGYLIRWFGNTNELDFTVIKDGAYQSARVDLDSLAVPITDIASGQHEIEVSWGAAGIKLYIDGDKIVENANAPVPGTIDDSYFYLGKAGQVFGYNTNHIFDGLRAYSVQLTDAEVASKSNPAIEPVLEDNMSMLANMNTSLAIAGPDAESTGVEMYAWDANGNSWGSTLVSNDAASPEELVATISANLTNYVVWDAVNSKAYVYTLLRSAEPSNGDIAARVDVDYHELEVTSTYMGDGSQTVFTAQNRGKNVIADGGFEKDSDGDGIPDDWSTYGSPRLERFDVYSGEACAKVKANNDFRQMRYIIPGQKYRLSGMVKSYDPDNPVSGRAALYWYNAVTQSAGQTIIDKGPYTSWTEIQAAITAPDNAVKVYVVLYSDSNENWVLWDDIQLEPVDSAQDTATKRIVDHIRILEITYGAGLTYGEELAIDMPDVEVRKGGTKVADAINKEAEVYGFPILPRKNVIEFSENGEQEAFEVSIRYRERWL